jgi:Family of unknown function (DUF6174)
MARAPLIAQLGVFLRWLLVALLAAAIIWVEGVKRQSYQSPAPSVAFVTAQRRWSERNLLHYRLTLRIQTPTDATQGGDLDVVIRNRQVRVRTCRPDAMSCRIYHAPGRQVDGVPTLFYLAQYGFQGAAGTTPGCLAVEYDPEYGYPRMIDTTRCAIPELKLIPVRLDVVNFRVLQ